MKQLFLSVLLLAGMALLAGCEQPQLPMESTAEPTSASTTAPTDVTTTEPTEPPTEPTPPAWLRDTEYLTYGEFFSEDRQYEVFRYPYDEDYVNSQRCSWYVMEGNTGTEYTLSLDKSNVPLPASLYLTDNSTGIREWIMVPGNLNDYTLLACDGRYAYLTKQSMPPVWQAEIARLDLATRTMEPIFQGDMVMDLYMCGDAVMYFARAVDGSIQICRMYLPEAKLDFLCSFEMLPGLFTALDCPASTLADVTWTTVAPEMLPLLEAELKDTKSEYRGDSSILVLWNTELPLSDPRLRWHIRELSNYLCLATGTKTRYIGTYHCADGTFSQEPVTDSPLSEAPKPVLVKSSWQTSGVDIQGAPEAEKPCENACAVILGNGFRTGYPGSYADGKVTRLSEDTVLEAVEADEGVYCITEENAIIQLAWDGSVRNTLYVGTEETLEKLIYREGFLYVLQGDEILEINGANGEYRVLIRHAGVELVRIANHGGLEFRQKDDRWTYIYYFGSDTLEQTT